MPVKFEWDLDPGSFQLDHVLNTSNGDTEAEFYSACPLGISPGTVPNDDIWKKFGLGDDFPDDELCRKFGIFEDATTATWMNPTSTKMKRGDILNHDCMWAGHCVSDKHDRNSQRVPIKNSFTAYVPVKKPIAVPPKQEEPKVIAVTTPDGTMTPDGGKICVKKNAVVAPTHARSLLLPSRIISNNQTIKTEGLKTPNNNCSNYISAYDWNNRSIKTENSSSETTRPETPQSLSDSEDLDFEDIDMDFRIEDMVSDDFGPDFINEIATSASSECSNDDDFFFDYSESDDGKNVPLKKVSVSPSKVTGVKLVSRTNVNVTNGNNCNGDTNTNVTVKTEAQPISRHYQPTSYFSDHCYHLSKSARMDHLGVQTPSDSEEEIDVETVYGDNKKPNSRSSSTGGVLPTNPSFSDRQQLQLTVASAINNKKEVKKQSARTTTVPTPRHASLDERTLKPNSKVVACKRSKNALKNSEIRRTGGNKRSAQFDEYEYPTKNVKRKKYSYQKHYKSGKSKKSKARRNHPRSSGGSSESEADSSEKRSMHNSMERQRRIDLRNAFEELRKLVPHTADNEKAAKVVILSSGAEFCQTLAQEEHELTRKTADLRRQQEMLRARLSQLRRHAAQYRRE